METAAPQHPCTCGEKHVQEMHYKFVVELAPCYVDADLQGMNQAPLTMTSSLSGEYSNHDTAWDTEGTLEAEALAVTKEASFVGFWQHRAAAEIIRCPLQSTVITCKRFASG